MKYVVLTTSLTIKKRENAKVLKWKAEIEVLFTDTDSKTAYNRKYLAHGDTKIEACVNVVNRAHREAQGHIAFFNRSHQAIA
jgi:hypothetical protein